MSVVTALLNGTIATIAAPGGALAGMVRTFRRNWAYLELSHNE